jgi:hypothetical protein
VNASGHSDMCVCVTAKPRGLRRRGVQGVPLGHLVGPALAGHLGVGGLLPEGDALPEGGGALRRRVLSSGVDRLSGLTERRCGRAYASGVRLHLPVSGQLVTPLLYHQRIPTSSGAARPLRTCKTLYLYCVLYCRLFPPSLRKEFFYAMRRG